MTTTQRYAAAAGMVLAFAGVSGLERAAAVQAAGARTPADMCALLTQEEAAVILGGPVAAPQKGASGTCSYATEAGMGGDIMIHNLPLRFASEEEFHESLVKDTEKTNARIKKQLGDAYKPMTVDPAPEVGQPAYYVDPQLVILKDGRVLGIVAKDRKQAVAVAAKAVPRF